MLGMLDLLGTIGGNILSLPGIVGLALGMATRNWLFAAIMGGLVGVLETYLFGGTHPGHVTVIEVAVAVLVGMAAGVVGCAIRHKGATV
ncbi:hypothetical protein [Amaricoccus sp. B4]|uniref:hypothetical protein n=1 Tax=Amaricoccus sp. B4 TaxID=3368557 RepID=UPI00371F7578